MRQYVSFACAGTNSAIVKVAEMSATLCGLSERMFVASMRAIRLFEVLTNFTAVSVASCVCIAKSGRSC